MRRATEIHLAPRGEDVSEGEPVGREHTTRSCWCEAVEVQIVLGLFRTEIVFFHRETGENE